MESCWIDMSMLDRVKNICGAETALGIRFCSPEAARSRLPQGSRIFGAAGENLFFFAEGYQETVFALDMDTGDIHPLAYDFSEFLRLILACGSAESVAGTERKDSRELGTFQPGLRELQEVLNLTPIRNPGEYVRTIGQVIDCSRIRQ